MDLSGGRQVEFISTKNALSQASLRRIACTLMPIKFKNCFLSVNYLAAIYVDHLPGYEWWIVRSQEYISRTQFRRLPGAFHRRFTSKVFDFFIIKCGYDERCPYRPRRYGVYTYPFFGQVCGQRPRKSGNGPFSWWIIDKAGRWTIAQSKRVCSSW